MKNLVLILLLSSSSFSFAANCKRVVYVNGQPTSYPCTIPHGPAPAMVAPVPVAPKPVPIGPEAGDRPANKFLEDDRKRLREKMEKSARPN